MNVDWRNPTDALDVNDDGFVVPLDVLLVINYINAREPQNLANQHDSGKPFIDVNGDQFSSPIDALILINHLNQDNNGQRGLTEVRKVVSETDVTITLGQTAGTRTYRVGLDATLDTAAAGTATSDLVAVYLVDPDNPSNTLLDRGTVGTSLFTLGANGKADYVPGLVAWDGSVLTLDLTNASPADTGTLKFQLLSGDTVTGSRLTIRPLSNVVDDTAEHVASFSNPEPPLDVGGPLDVAGLASNSSVRVEVQNVRFAVDKGRYTADMVLFNSGSDLGSSVAVAFPGLPSGVTLRSPSGTTSSGLPYLNVKPSILRGGLAHGTATLPIQLEFDDPALIPFSIRPQVLAGVNHAPTLATIVNQSVIVGGVLRVPLIASDADEDSLIFDVQAIDGSSIPANGRMESNGTLVFRPAPDQVGSTDLRVTVSDGVLSTTSTFSLNVLPDANTSTRISGKILQVNGQPLADMRVDLGASQVLTQSDGSFTVDVGAGPVVSDTIRVRGDLFTGTAGTTVYPFIAEKLQLMLGHGAYTGVNNVIDRPIYLPALDVANGKTINPTVDTTVTTAALPDVSVFIQAGSLMNQLGTPFTGTLSITQVPTNLTPAALPANQRPGLVVTIQPGEMVFTRPAPMTFPNPGWAVGTTTDLMSINPVTGEFEDVGDMRVSADGKLLETISGGVRNSSWHYVPPPPPPKPVGSGSGSGTGTGGRGTGNPRNEDAGCGPCDINSHKEKEFSSQIDLFSGAVIETHDLVTYQSQGVERGLSLKYDSLRADPRPIVHVGFEGTAQDPIRVPASNQWMTAGVYLVNAPLTTTTPIACQANVGCDGGASSSSSLNYWTYTSTQKVDLALQLDMRSQPSGVYEYSVSSGYAEYGACGGALCAPGFSYDLTSSDSELVSVNSVDSPFGSGWGLAGQQTLLVSSPETLLLVDGGGGETVYRFDKATDSYVSPTGDFSKLEKVGGLFRRTTPDQTRYQFNSDNQLATITDRNGNVTTYNYSGKRLVGLVDPVGSTTTLTYTGNRVTAITDPAGRQTRLDYDAQGNLVSITDPDSAIRRWEYDSGHHMIAEVDALGRREETTYGFHGRATSARHKDGSSVQIRSPQVEALYPPDRTRDPFKAPKAFVLGTVESNFADANGRVTRSRLDRRGQVISESDSLGNLPSEQRNQNNLPSIEVDGRGNGTEYTYDGSGNLLTQRDSLSTANANGLETTEVAGSISFTGEVDRYSFYGVAGQVLVIDSQQNSNPSASLLIALLDPSDSFLSSDNTMILTKTGTYTLSVQYPTGLEATGSYRLRIVNVGSATVLPLGTNIHLPSQVTQPIYWSIDGTRGQKLSFTDQFVTSFAQFQLRQQANIVTTYNTSGNHTGFNVTIPESGRYTLVMFPNSLLDYTGDGFRADLTDPQSVAKSGLDVDRTGTLTSGQEQSFSLSAPAGTVVLVEIDNSVVQVDLRDETTGKIVLREITNNLILPSAGSYTAIVRNDSSDVQDFRLRVIDLTATASVTIGTPLTGTVVKDRSQIFQFVGKAGDRIGFGPRQPGLNAQLLSLDSSQASQQATDIVTLKRSGEYFLRLDTQFVESAAYKLRLIDVQQATPIAFDATISSELQVGGPPIYYSFDAQPGDRFFLDDLGSSPAVEISIFSHGFSDSLIYGGVGQALTTSEGTIRIDSKGIHTIVLNAADSNLPASFRFRLLSSKTTHSALTLGQDVFGAISEPNETHVYTFNGTVGQRLFLDGQSPVLQDALITIRNPSGAILNSLSPLASFSDSPIFVLPQTGQYELELKHFASRTSVLGNYHFTLSDANQVSSVSVNDNLTGSLVNGLQAKLYRFDGYRGQRISINKVSQDDVSYVIYSPAGYIVAATLETDTTLPETGSYIFLITSSFDLNNAKSFSFELRDISDTLVTSSGFDVLLSGDRSEGDIAVGDFSANAGEQLTIETLQASNQVNLRLFDPFNVELPISVVTVLPRSGQYHLRLTNAVSSAVGQYAFRVRRTTDAPIIDTDSTITGNLASFGEKAIYRFDSSGSSGIYLDRLNNDANIVFRVFDPAGREVSATDAYAPYALPIAGTYSLVIERGQANGSFAFQLRSIDVAPLIQYGDEVSGTVNPSSLAVLRRFVGQAGQKIYFDGDRAGWRIVGPEGHVLPFLSNVTKDSIELPNNGQYIVIRDNDGVDPSDYRFKTTSVTEPLRVLNAAPKQGFRAYTYDTTFHQLTSEVDELGRTTLLDLDPANGNTLRFTRVVGPVGGTDDVVTSYTYTSFGLIDTIVDPLGNVTDNEYNAQGRLTSITFAKGTTQQSTSSLEYDAAGNVTATIDGNGHRTQFAYDARNRLTRITAPDPDGAGPLSAPVTQYTYDSVGNLLTVTDALGQMTTNTYDSLDRLISQSDSQNHVSRIEYDKSGNPISIVDPQGKSQTIRYDARNRAIGVIDAAGGLTSFTYDADNNPLSVTDASGNLTTYTYDARGRLTRRVDPLGAVDTFTYDVVNNVVQRTDRLGRTTESTYDELNQLTNESWHASDGTILNSIDSTYDAAGNLISIRDVTSELQFTYDARNRVTRVRTSGASGLPTSVLDYVWDAAGNRISLTDTINGQAGATTASTYDALNRTIRLVQSGTNVSNKRVDLTYNALNQLTNLGRFSDANGQSSVANTAYAYDSLNRVSSVTHRNATNAVVDSFVFQYDAMSRISRLTDVDGSTDYQYDSRGEVTSANHADSANPDETYAYDPTGNRTASHLPGSAYVVGDGVANTADNNRLTSDGKYHYVYDAAGNLVQRTNLASGAVREFSWDLRNRLVAVTDRLGATGTITQVIEYKYDALNRRIAKEVDTTPADGVDGAVTYFVYDNEDIVVELRDADGSGPQATAMSMRYLHGPEVDQVFAQENSVGSVLWMLSDHLGTTRDIVNNAGQVVDHVKYDTFGAVISETNQANSSSFLFAGREFDRETGLFYFRARYYDTSNGRFISEDPIEFEGRDVNLYRYVGNRPTNQRDPNGTVPVVGFLIGGAILVTGAFLTEMAYYLPELYPEKYGQSGQRSGHTPGQSPPGVQNNQSKHRQAQPKLPIDQQLLHDIWRLKKELDEARLELKDCALSDVRRLQLRNIIQVNQSIINRKAQEHQKLLDDRERNAKLLQDALASILR